MRTRTRIRWVAIPIGLAALLAIGVVMLGHRSSSNRPVVTAGDTSSLGGPAAASSGSATAATAGDALKSPTSQPIRWWDSPAGRAGSAIDVERPEAGAATLHADTHAYCAMLRSSVTSSFNPLTSQATGTDNVVATVRAWSAELEAMSAGAVHDAWAVLGPALIDSLTGKKPSAATGSAVAGAIATVTQDAQATCKLDLSHASS